MFPSAGELPTTEEQPKNPVAPLGSKHLLIYFLLVVPQQQPALFLFSDLELCTKGYM